MPMKLEEVALARANAIRDALLATFSVPGDVGADFNSIVASLVPVVGTELAESLLLPRSAFYGEDGDEFCEPAKLRSKLFQLIGILKAMAGPETAIVEIGTLYNAIRDPVLKERCADVLSGKGPFDRAINQATLVLEDRLRTIGNGGDKVGAPLVSYVLANEQAKSRVQIKGSAEEHEGIGHICRGLVLAFRNPTHHKVADSYSREDALKVCAFIDTLLSVIESATVHP